MIGGPSIAIRGKLATLRGLGLLSKGSDLWGMWVEWPGSGGPWPVGAYLGHSKENGRRMWQTISPHTGEDLRLHIPDNAEIVEGPYTLHHGHFKPIAQTDLDYPSFAHVGKAWCDCDGAAIPCPPGQGCRIAEGEGRP